MMEMASVIQQVASFIAQRLNLWMKNKKSPILKLLRFKLSKLLQKRNKKLKTPRHRKILAKMRQYQKNQKKTLTQEKMTLIKLLTIMRNQIKNPKKQSQTISKSRHSKIQSSMKSRSKKLLIAEKSNNSMLSCLSKERFLTSKQQIVISDLPKFASGISLMIKGSHQNSQII